MTTGRAIVLALLGLIVAATEIGTVYFCFSFPEMFDFTFDLIVYMLLTLLTFAVVVILFKTVYDSTIIPLTFNNINFTFKGKTYTYHQIEEIKLRSGRYGSIAFEIRVHGKKLYSFDNEYEGAKEFMHYLNFYEVPGTPRA